MSAVNKDESEMQAATIKTEGTICPRDDGRLNPVRPLARLVAEMIERSYWAHSGIRFEASPATGHVFFKVGASSSVCVSGYHLAYQVKLCVDLLADCGYFT